MSPDGSAKREDVLTPQADGSPVPEVGGARGVHRVASVAGWGAEQAVLSSSPTCGPLGAGGGTPWLWLTDIALRGARSVVWAVIGGPPWQSGATLGVHDKQGNGVWPLPSESAAAWDSRLCLWPADGFGAQSSPLRARFVARLEAKGPPHGVDQGHSWHHHRGAHRGWWSHRGDGSNQGVLLALPAHSPTGDGPA